MCVYYEFIVNGACYKIFEYLFKNAIVSQISTKMEMINKIARNMITKFYDIYIVNSVPLLCISIKLNNSM